MALFLQKDANLIKLIMLHGCQFDKNIRRKQAILFSKDTDANGITRGVLGVALVIFFKKCQCCQMLHNSVQTMITITSQIYEIDRKYMQMFILQDRPML